MIKSVVISFKVPVIEVLLTRLSNESSLPRTTDLTPLTMVLDG